MVINLSIKKYLPLAAGLLFCGAAKAAETATYTWDFSSAAAVMGGTATGNFNTAQDAEKGTVLTGSTFDERGTNVFREMLNGALSGEGTMSITMDISWGGNNSLENIPITRLVSFFVCLFSLFHTENEKIIDFFLVKRI